jgi:hypothetical protein
VILLLAGCFGIFPFRNEAPRMTSFNDMPLETDIGGTGTSFGFTEDLLEEQPIWMTVQDPERDEVTVWFPYLTGTIGFDQDTLEGVWRPDFESGDSLFEIEVVLEDDRDPPARSEWVFYWVGDTG